MIRGRYMVRSSLDIMEIVPKKIPVLKWNMCTWSLATTLRSKVFSYLLCLKHPTNVNNKQNWCPLLDIQLCKDNICTQLPKHNRKKTMNDRKKYYMCYRIMKILCLKKTEISLKCKKKYEELIYFKCFVWNVRWWFLENQNM